MSIKRLIEGRKQRYAFIAGIIAIGGFAIFGDKGLLDVYRLRGERDRISDYNNAITDENARLEHEISLLKTNQRYIGYIARQELGVIGKNEVIYNIRNPKAHR